MTLKIKFFGFLTSHGQVTARYQIWKVFCGFHFFHVGCVILTKLVLLLIYSAKIDLGFCKPVFLIYFIMSYRQKWDEHSFLSWKCGGHLYTFNILQRICFLIARILAWAVKVIAFGIFFCFSVQVWTASIKFARGSRNSCCFFLNHICSHGSSLGSNPLLIFSTILTIACVSLSLCRIFDIWIIEQILQKKQRKINFNLWPRKKK